jgi:flavodoxin
VRVTVSKRKLAGRNKGGGGVSDSGSTAAVAAVAAAKTAADRAEEHKGDDDDDDDGEEEDAVTAVATASSTHKRRRVNFSGATTVGSGGGSSGSGVDARFASTRSTMGGAAHAHGHIHTRTQQAGGTITTPMSTRKKARLEKHALDDISYSGLQQEELEELFSRVRHNRSKVVHREHSSDCIHLNHTNHH